MPIFKQVVAYRTRVIAQCEAWVRGDSKHNFIDDECCPDFSCCVPACFEPDRLKRIAVFNTYLLRRGLPPRGIE